MELLKYCIVLVTTMVSQCPQSFLNGLYNTYSLSHIRYYWPFIALHNELEHLQCMCFTGHLSECLL